MGAETPLLGVVTVNRDMRDGLARTLASVRACAAPDLEMDLEHVVVDGASGDGSQALLAAAATPALRWRSEPDAGIYDAMNKGVRRAAARWLLFLNAGDVLTDPASLAALLAAAEAAGADIAYGDAEIAYADGSVAARPAAPVAGIERRMPFAHAATLIRRDLLLARPYGTDGQACDYAFFLACWCEGRRFLHVPGVVARIEAGGLSDRRRVRSTIERWRAVRAQGRASMALAVWYAASLARAALAPSVSVCLPAGLLRRMRGGRPA